MYFKATFCALVALSGLAAAQDTSLAEVQRAFEAANIPENLTITFDPTILLEVVFPLPSGDNIPVHAGMQLPRNATAGPPIFGIRNLLNVTRGPFVIVTVDPDAPTPQDPVVAQIRHFLGGDFVATEQNEDRLANATVPITGWRQPTPPASSAPHRYVFLLFDQSRGFNQQTVVNATTPVTNFNISQFADVVGLGDPVGGTFILVGAST